MSSPVFTFAAELTGLVSGYLFAADGSSRVLESDEAQAWLLANRGKRGSDGEFIWLHFNEANSSTERWLREHVDLAEEFFEALREGSRSTRVEYADETLVGILNDVVYDFSFVESSQVSTLWLSVDQRRLISVRRQPLRSVDRLRMAVKHGVKFPSPLALVVHLLRDQADVLIAIVRNTAHKVDAIEDKLLAGRSSDRRRELGTLRRDLVRLQRLLAPEPAALFRLLNRPPVWLASDDAHELRQSTEEFSLVLRDMNVLQERIKLLQEEIATGIDEQTSRTVFVLTAVTVLALPINMVAGLFGMNVGGIPYAQDEHGFWTVVSLVAAFTIGAAVLLFRKRND